MGGPTTPNARKRVERALANSSVLYEVPPAGSGESPPTRSTLFLVAAGAVVILAWSIYLLGWWLNSVGEMLDQAVEEQQERDEQNQKMVGRTLEGAARTFGSWRRLTQRSASRRLPPHRAKPTPQTLGRPGG